MGKINYGGIIKNARMRMGLTLADVAEKVGTSKSALSQLENNMPVNPPSPDDMVSISDAIMDREMLHEFCNACPVRSRIIIRKFPPLNNILTGVHVSVLKGSQKLAEAMDALQAMLPKILRKGFNEDPDFLDYRNNAVLKLLDVKRGAEIIIDQLMSEGVITDNDLRMLIDMQQRLCEEHGHHIPER